MYKVGDLIIYKNIGVCRVEEIGRCDVQERNEEQIYYTLCPLYRKSKIFVPVDSKLFMRPVISNEEAARLIGTIPAVSERVKSYSNRAMSALEEDYKEYFKNHDCGDLLELMMSIYAKKQEAIQQKHKLGAVDEKFMKQAEDLLFGELAVALGIEKDGVPDYIEARLKLRL